MCHVPAVNICIIYALCCLTVVKVDKCAASFGNKEETFVIHAARTEERKYIDCEDGTLLGIFHGRVRNFYNKVSAVKSVGDVNVINRIAALLFGRNKLLIFKKLFVSISD